MIKEKAGKRCPVLVRSRGDDPPRYPPSEMEGGELPRSKHLPDTVPAPARRKKGEESERMRE